MPMVTRFSSGPPRKARSEPQGFGGGTEHLDHFRQIAAMAALLDRLPGAAERPAYTDAQDFIGDSGLPDDDFLNGYAGLDPLTRRAFEAVAAGLDKLAESAADLCDQNEPLTPVEMEACAAIGKSMRQLLQRAAALVESSDGQETGDHRPGAGNCLRNRSENKN
jgi:hypothetical protein